MAIDLGLSNDRSALLLDCIAVTPCRSDAEHHVLNWRNRQLLWRRVMFLVETAKTEFWVRDRIECSEKAAWSFRVLFALHLAQRRRSALLAEPENKKKEGSDEAASEPARTMDARSSFDFLPIVRLLWLFLFAFLRAILGSVSDAETQSAWTV